MNKIIVLSLKDSSRREIITKRLLNIGIEDFEFYDAVDVRDFTEEKLNKIFDLNRFRQHYGRDVSKGEIGCTLSHIGIWNKIANSKCFNWIVLEDDAILTSKFKSLYNLSIELDGVVLLGYSKVSSIRSYYHYLKRRIYNTKKYFDFSYGKINKEFSCGTVGYLIDKKSAKSLCNKSNNLPFYIADDWELYSSTIDIFHSRPFLVFEDYKKIPSDIDQERSLK